MLDKKSTQPGYCVNRMTYVIGLFPPFFYLKYFTHEHFFPEHPFMYFFGATRRVYNVFIFGEWILQRGPLLLRIISYKHSTRPNKNMAVIVLNSNRFKTVTQYH